ncbi:MAG TPA: hypothetical protein VKA65_09630 [Acidimicrobiales bacterium]|nr:hypothetical protein [Acidimicrobiales bacterium]
MGAGTAHAVALGGVAVVVLLVAGVLAVLGVDTVEVVATLLVIPVFGVALYLGRQPGYIAAGVATALYMVLRQPDVESAGVANLGLLVITRAVAYVIVVYAGSRARQTVGEATPGGGGVPADERGLRQAPTAARSPVFVFDEDGVAEPVPAGAPGPFGGPPAGPGPAPGFHAGGGQQPAPYAAVGPGGPNDGRGGPADEDEWVDQPHPSDWLVGPAALPPDDPESGPWTGPVPLPGDDPAVTGGWGAPAAGAGAPSAPGPGVPWGPPGAPDDRAGWAAAAPAGPLDLPGPPAHADAGPGAPDDPWSPPGRSTWGPTAAVPGGPGEWPAPAGGAGGPRNGTPYADDGYVSGDAYADAPDGYAGDGYDDGCAPGYDDGRADDAYGAPQGPPTGGWPPAPPGGPASAGTGGDWQAGVPVAGRGVPGPAADPGWAAEPPGPGLTPSGRWDAVPPDGDPWAAASPTSGPVPAVGYPGKPPAGPARAPGPWDEIVPPPNGRASGLVPNNGAARGAPAAAAAAGGIPAPGPVLPAIPPIDPETRLWSARYLCDRLADAQNLADETGDAFSLVLVQVPDGPLAALSYRRQVTLLRELGHQFVAGGTVDHLVHVPDQTQHWFAVVLPGADKGEAQRFERRLRDGIGGYLRSRGLLLGELDSASLTSPDDDEAMGAIWDALIARGDAGSNRQPAVGA